MRAQIHVPVQGGSIMREVTIALTGGLASLVMMLALHSSASADLSLAALQGSYSATGQGSFSACLLPPNYTEVPCSTSGALPFPFSYAGTGQVTVGSSGAACSTSTAVAANLPPGAPPPLVAVDHEVLTVTDYDATTETGDISSKAYLGGKCNGAAFDPTGAMLYNSFTYHFAVTENGKRWDLVVTHWTDPQGGAAQIVATTTLLRQSGKRGSSRH
jgi:hypothetical protein